VDAPDPSTGLHLTLGFEPSRLEAERPVRWTFTVENRGSEHRTLVFASAQQGDVVLERDGEPRYRWGQDKLFAEVITERQLPPRAAWTFSLEDVLAVAPGTYALLATVTARPTPPPVRTVIDVH
jgi:Intracellular proteinase inhibitor